MKGVVSSVSNAVKRFCGIFTFKKQAEAEFLVVNEQLMNEQDLDQGTPTVPVL
jgi:hypothetical protein